MSKRLHILGTGPAALLLAVAAREVGLDVTLVGPVRTGFVPTYGLWTDQVDGSVLAPAVSHRWSAVRVGERRLEMGYARLDSSNAASLLWGLASDCRVVDARVDRVEATPDGFRVHTSKGALDAHRVVDATGHRPVAIQRTPASHHQVALGATLHTRHGLTEPILMDFSGPGTAPTFLYALPLDAGRLFVEETALITAHPPSFRRLETRLRDRLERLDLDGPLDVHEHCLFPMDPGVPEFGPVLGFGAAASLVHPATGYQLAACLDRAAPLARSLAATWDRSVDAAAAAGWATLWPHDVVRARDLQVWGARYVAGLERADQAAFFDAFFSMPAANVRAYLAPNASLSCVVEAMCRTFAALPAPLELDLAQRGLARPVPLIRPLLGLQEVS